FGPQLLLNEKLPSGAFVFVYRQALPPPERGPPPATAELRVTSYHSSLFSLVRPMPLNFSNIESGGKIPFGCCVIASCSLVYGPPNTCLISSMAVDCMISFTRAGSSTPGSCTRI